MMDEESKLTDPPSVVAQHMGVARENDVSGRFALHTGPQSDRERDRNRDRDRDRERDKDRDRHERRPRVDPHLQAVEQGKAMQEHFKANPILGLARKQQKRFDHIKGNVDKIRGLQQEIFLSQFEQVPELGQSEATYDHIFNSFQTKDQDVKKLVGQLKELTEHIDEVNKFTAAE